jgi:hypothetical protein
VLVLDPDPALLPKRILLEAMGELRALVSARTQVSRLLPACAAGSGHLGMQAQHFTAET